MHSPNSKRASIGSISTISSNTSNTSTTSSISTPATPSLYRHSSTSSNPSNFRPTHHPKIQLIPHAQTPIYHDSPLTTAENALVRQSESAINTIDHLEMDFDDLFIFDRPAHTTRRLRQGCVEVSVRGTTHTRSEAQRRNDGFVRTRRDWGDFSFSHFGPTAAGAKQKPGMAGMQRELWMVGDLSRLGGVGEGIGAKYVRNRGFAGVRR